MTSQPSQSRPTQPIGREPLLTPTADMLVRYQARLLDPTTAVRVPGQPPIRPTVYIGNRLMLRGVAPDTDRYGALGEAASKHGLKLEPHATDQPVRNYAARNRAVDLARWPTRVRLVPTTNQPQPPADAWHVLQTFRTIVDDPKQIPQDVALEHLLAATGGPWIGGVPQTQGGGVGGAPQTQGGGLAMPSYQYGMPGWGGRAPVAWVGPEPVRRPDNELTCRRPVIAVLDTGIGSHRWFEDGSVQSHVTVAGVPIGLTDPATDAELTGVTVDPLEGVLDSDAGHGTFIAGLIRQKCPDATILAIRIMSGDGVVAEGDLLNAVSALVTRQKQAQQADDADSFIDVLSLSLGYYHEQPEDPQFDPMLLGPLQELGKCGVVVLASAGNDATTRPFFPAGFTPYAGGVVAAFNHDSVPVVSVGARNPNGRSVALFSNAGDWVTCDRPGAALVSTLPMTFNASIQPAVEVQLPGGGVRATIDIDDFRGGFGVWSGTSFAAPVLAGEIAQRMFEGNCGPTGELDPGSTVDRGWDALTHLIGLDRP